MRLCGVSGIHFLRHGEQIILLFFIVFYKTVNFKNHEIAGFTTLCNTI